MIVVFAFGNKLFVSARSHYLYLDNPSNIRLGKDIKYRSVLVKILDDRFSMCGLCVIKLKSLLREILRNFPDVPPFCIATQ